MRAVVLCLSTALLLGCAANSSRPIANISEGERLYRANCASCHSLRNPADYSDEEWTIYVAKYGQKLSLSAEKQSAILTHLQSSN